MLAILGGYKDMTRRLVTPENSLIDSKSARTREGKAIWAKLDWERARTFASMSAFEDETVDAFWVPEIGQPDDSGHTIDPYVRAGDVLIGKETFSTDFKDHYPNERVWYRADMPWRDGEIESRNGVRGIWSPESQVFVPFKWRPSIFMTKDLSRLRLEVTDTFPQRLQEISEVDCRREGVKPGDYFSGAHREPKTAAEVYSDLWNMLNEKKGTRWEDNPPVWVRVFKRI